MRGDVMFSYHDEEKSPEESAAILKEAHAEFGFVPNMVRVMAEAPATYEAYKKSFEILFHKTSLSLVEAQIILLTVSVENKCHYDVAAHSWGMKMSKISDEVIRAIRSGAEIEDTKFEELRSFTIALMKSHGHLPVNRVQQFLGAGFSHKNILEILIGISSKTISNLTNNLADTKLDEAMNEFSWKSHE